MPKSECYRLSESGTTVCAESEVANRQIQEEVQLTQTWFAAASVSKGHMSEVEAGIAALSEKIKDLPEEPLR